MNNKFKKYPVKSSFINNIEYSHHLRQLKIKIRNKEYIYSSVPASEAVMFLVLFNFKSGSPGRLFNQNIKPFYKCHLNLFFTEVPT